MSTRHIVLPHRSDEKNDVIIRIDGISASELAHRIATRLDADPGLEAERVRANVFEVAPSVAVWRVVRRRHAPTSRIRVLDTTHGAQAIVVGSLSARVAEALAPLGEHTTSEPTDVIDLSDDTIAVATIEVIDGSTWLRDLGSDHGTWVTDADGRHQLPPHGRMEVTGPVTVHTRTHEVVIDPTDG